VPVCPNAPHDIPQPLSQETRSAGGRRRLDLDTDGLVFRKWGAEQRCRAGDWLVDNDGEVYAVSAESFAANYTQVSCGLYVKTGLVEREKFEAMYEAVD
jgi:hypothetical protein